MGPQHLPPARVRRVLGLAAAVLLVGTPAVATIPRSLAACQDEGAAAAARIAACSRLIDDLAVIAEVRAEAHLNRGIAYESRDEDDRAIADYSAAIAINPEYPALYHYRGSAYERAGESQRAIADFTTALKLDPTDAEALYYRAQTYAQIGQHDLAIADYGEAIRLEPDDADAYAGRAASYEAKQQRAEAIADFRKAMSLEPDNEEAKAGLQRLGG